MFSGIKHSIYEDADKIRIYGSEAGKFIEDIGFLGEKQKHAMLRIAEKNGWLKKKAGLKNQVLMKMCSLIKL